MDNNIINVAAEVRLDERDYTKLVLHKNAVFDLFRKVKELQLPFLDRKWSKLDILDKDKEF